MNFEFATSARIIFGAGTLSQAGNVVAKIGRKVLIVAGRDPARVFPLQRILNESGLDCSVFSVPSEPTVALVSSGAKLAREMEAEVIVGFGGGSAIDGGKAIAAFATNPEDPFRFLEVVGAGEPLAVEPLPFIAIPTNAGTGAEVTRNAVLTVPERETKASLRSAAMLPRVAIIDPELTYGLPAQLTATTGLDALTQLIEPFVSARHNPLTDSLCREGMRRCGQSLRAAYTDGANKVAREDMALASLFGGLALANSGLGAVHGFAAAIGGMFPLAHGAICARLLPIVWRTNLAAALRDESQKIIARFDGAAQILAGENATAQDGVHWLESLVNDLRIEPLRSAGITRDHFPSICEKAARASSMKANPVQLSHEELMQILEQAL